METIAESYMKEGEARAFKNMDAVIQKRAETIAESYIKEGEARALKNIDAVIQKRAETIAESYVKKGEAKALRKTALNMLKQELDTQLISQITGLSTSEIDRLRD